MFKLNPAPTFVAAVALSVAGMPERVELAITFRYKGKTALQAWILASKGKADVALLHEVVADWSGVLDDDGNPVPYSLTALGNLLENYPIAHNELFDAYVRELGESKRKNS